MGENIVISKIQGGRQYENINQKWNDSRWK